MAVKPLNSVAGFSVGDSSPANIILANGDITTNNFTTTGVANLNAIANVKMTGGTSGQVIQTDGTGNLSFVTISTTGLTNGTSNVQVYNSSNIGFSIAGGANTVVFTSTGINVAGYGNFGTGVITGNGSGLTSIPGANIIGQAPNALVAGTVYTAAQPNITSVGTLTSLAVTGNISGANVTGNMYGNGAGLSALTGANVTGTVANATYAVSAGSATTAGTVTTNAQPNITSVGTLTSLAVTGNVTAGNVVTSGVLTSNVNGSATQSALLISGSINSLAGNIGLVTIGNTLNYTDTNIVQTMVGNANSYVQSILQNQNTGTVASADFIVSADVASNSVYGDFGINSSNFAGAGGPFDDARATYLYGAGGNLGIGTSGANVVKIGTNNTIRVIIDTNGNANFSGNITAPNIIANTGVFSGNGAGLSSLVGANVTGTVANANYATYSGSATTAGTVTTASQPNITSVGTLTGLTVGNVTANTVFGNGTITASGNVSGGNITVVSGGLISGANAVTANYFTGTLTTSLQPNITSVGTLTALSVTGNITTTTGVIFGNGSGLTALTGSNVTGQVGNALVAGTVYTAAQPNITSVGTLTSLGVSGNITAANHIANTGAFYGSGAGLTSIPGGNVTGTVANATYATNAGSATSATTAGTVTTAAQPNITSVGTLTSVTVSGNSNLQANVLVGNYVQIANNSSLVGIKFPGGSTQFGLGMQPSIDGTTLVTFFNAANTVVGSITETANNVTFNGLVTGSNVTGTVANATYAVSAGSAGTATSATTAGTVTTAAQPNITSVGTLTGLTIGNSTANAVFGNGTITLNSGLITGNGAGLSSLNGSNVTGTVANATYATSAGTATTATTALTVTTAAQPNITSVGTLTSLTVTGNTTSGNLITGGLVSATGNVTGGNLTTGGILSVTGNANIGNIGTAGLITATGNITGANLIAGANIQVNNWIITAGNNLVFGPSTGVTLNYGNLDPYTGGYYLGGGTPWSGIFANTANHTTMTVTANANVGNLGTTGTIIATGNIQSNTDVIANTYTSVSGNVTVTAATGNNSVILAPTGTGIIDAYGVRIANVANPTYSSDVATKYYVDNAVSAGLFIHSPVVADADSSLSATYANGGTSPTWTTITTNNTLATASAHGLSVNDMVVFTSTTNGVTANTPYFVYSVPTSTTITISNTYAGTQINTLTNGTGLTIGSNCNYGVGATLTSTGTGPLVLNSYTCALNDRVIVHGQATSAQNGVYYISQVGVASSTPWILTRATDANKYIPNSANGLDQGSYFLVTGNGEAYVQTDAGPIMFGTTSITFSLFSQTSTYTAGTGLSLSSYQFSIASTSVTAGSYGNGDRVASFTVNAQGQLTAAANTVIQANAANLTGTTLATTVVSSSLTSVGTLTGLTVSGTTNLGAVGNVTITGGTSGQYLQTNGSGGLSWSTISTSSISNGNSNVVVSANGNVTISSAGAANVLTVTSTGANIAGYLNTGTGNVTAGNLITSGSANISGSANVGTSLVLGNTTVTTTVTWASTTTSSVSANQTIASFNVTGVTGVEFFIKGVDSAGAKYSVATIHAVTDGANVDWVTYGGAFLNSYTGSFSVAITGGAIKLQVTPASSNSTVWTTQYKLI